MKPVAVLWLAMSMMLAGCSDAGLSALDRRLAGLRDSPAGGISPLPDMPRYHAVTYDQADSRSPFRSKRPEAERAGGDGGDLAPDFSRPREPLEAYPLESLKLVGTLRIDGRRSALVRDPVGQVHRLYAGERMGADFGRIVAITDASVQLVEIVSNGQDGWVERSRTISFNDGADGQARSEPAVRRSKG